MSGSSAGDRQAKLEHVLAEYLHALEQGRPVDRAALVAAHPDLAGDLQSFFRNRDAVEHLAVPLKAAADAATLTGPPQLPADAPTVTGPPEMASPSASNVVRYFGNYELLDEIARGGMGVVYKARQVNLNRIVALKMILAGQLANDSDVKRFYAEAEAAANLDHPGIVPIFEIGQHEGQHYFSMAFIQGQSLAKKVADGPFPPREAAELVRKIAEAVEYAHQKGIIHRDLKPANVLLDGSGQPKVTDFGLAKQTKGDSGLTGTGQILGTPSYMPPEQAAGKIDLIGPQADVYSLGAILYCLLTGRPPFQAANPMDTLLQVLDDEPVSPRQLNAQIPRDLETICLKCVSKEAEKRYGSAGELADDLRRFEDHEPIIARPAGFVERAVKWSRRRPALAALIAVAVAGLVVVAWETQVANREWARAERELTRAERLLDDSQARLYINSIELAGREWEAGRVDRAVTALDSCEAPRRGWEWNYLQRLCHAELVKIPVGYDAPDVAFSRDGRLLAVANFSNRRIDLFDSQTGAPAGNSAGHEFGSVCARFSDDGNWLVSGGWWSSSGKGGPTLK
jgi:tRNA A-37 threonylcarbamoyl transferase component Bud32